jgi:ankyrin repeat protein
VFRIIGKNIEFFKMPPKNNHSSTSSIIDNESIARTKPKRVVVFQREEIERLRLQKEANEVLIETVYFEQLPRLLKCLKNGVDVNIKNYVGDTALIVSSLLNHMNIAQILINNNANINIQNLHGDTALMLASMNNNVNIVKLLLENGADANLLNQHDYTALYLSVQYNYINTVEILLQHKANVNIKDNNGVVVLQIASSRGSENIVRLLLDYNADVNSQDRGGFTSLKLASLNNHESIVYMLLDNGARVNIENCFGETALHVACFHQHFTIARLLLTYGADINMITLDLHSPLDYINNLEQKQSLFDFAQLCPVECWRRRRDMVYFQSCSSVSFLAPAPKILSNKDIFRHIVKYI